VILEGRGISRGKGEGELLLIDEPFSFLGGVNPSTGELISTGKRGENIRNRVLAFPYGKGSTVGSYVLLDLKRCGNAPAAIINERAEPIVATGAVMAGIPLVDLIDLSLLKEGDRVKVSGTAERVELPEVRQIHVVTCLVRYGEKILLLRRSDRVGSFSGKWAGISGYVEENEKPLETAYRELREVARLENSRLLRSAPVIHMRADDTVWSVHAYLFEASSAEIKKNWEHTEYRWIAPEEALEFDTVPGLDTVLRELELIKTRI